MLRSQIHMVPIPARESAPATSLYVKIVFTEEESLKSKPYIFMLPGGPGFNHSHYKDYSCLSEIGNVVFHDPRGCGLSDKADPATYTMENYIDDIEAIRKHLKLSKIALVGKSYGAMCALGYVLRYPDVVSKLVLAAGATSYRFLETAKQNFFSRQPTQEQMQICEKLWDGSFADDEELAQYISLMRPYYSYKVRHGEAVNRPAPDYPYSFAPINQGFKGFLREFDFEDQLEKINCETLILVGEEDWITDKKYSQLMAERIKGSQLKIFPKSDHSMESDVPESYFGAINVFISAQQLLDFYPVTTLHEEHWIPVSDIHQIYVARYGNPNGIPVIMLHGGPGSSSADFFPRFFDPEKYNIIVSDQRGAGKSKPKGEMRENTTQDLIKDIETIREFFTIEKCVIFGGSWGSSLALMYAESYPQNVMGLILRGIFLVRAQDPNAFLEDGSIASQRHPKEWEAFKVMTQGLIDEAGLKLVIGKDRMYEDIYYALVFHPNMAIAKKAAGYLAGWEKFCSFLKPSQADFKDGQTEDGVNMAKTECHYFRHGCFVEANYILDNLHRLKGIPVYIAQGEEDYVCPPNQADALEAGLIKINGEGLVIRRNVMAGHSHKEPALKDALIRFGNDFAARLELEFEKKTLSFSVSSFTAFHHSQDTPAEAAAGLEFAGGRASPM